MAGSLSRAVRLNTDTGFLKLLAMASMLADHLGAAFFPSVGVLRIIGRLAFPLYAYCAAAGSFYTKKPLAYALRVLILAILTQPIYCIALSHVTADMQAAVAGGLSIRSALTWYVYSLNRANILFSLFLGILLMTSIREKRYIVAGLCVLAAWYFSDRINYGWRGIALMALFYAFLDAPVASFAWVLGFMVWWGVTGGGTYSLFGIRFSLQGFAVLALPFIYVPTNTGIRWPKWVFYAFYPAHLAVIWAIRVLL